MTAVTQRSLLVLGVVVLMLLLIGSAVGVGAVQWATWQQMQVLNLKIERLEREYARIDERTQTRPAPCEQAKGER